MLHKKIQKPKEKKEKVPKLSKKQQELLAQRENVVRYFPTQDFGLSCDQVKERELVKLTNNTKIKSTKSYLSIFCKNIFTFFNFLWALIAIALFMVGAYSDLIFIFVIVANTAVAIIQEIRAKITVEKLSIVTAPRIKTIRDGVEIEIASDKLVLDDIVILSNGDQVPADCVIVDGNIEVNESLLTGESNAIRKTKSDRLLSGSFLVAGKCYARVDKVGKDNYIWQMAARAKEFKAPSSNLFKDLNRLIKYIGISLVPIGLLTFLKEYMVPDSTIKNVIISTSGALTSMIPAGMFLLITVSLAVGVVKLSRKNTLVKDLYSIEMLARTNVLCLDKTGTITDGTMKVVDFVTFGKRQANVKKLLSNVLYNQKSTNATSNAMIKEFGIESDCVALDTVEFSSERKYSITHLTSKKTYFLGATSKIKCKLTPEQKAFIEEQQNKGLRVVALTECDGPYAPDMDGSKSSVIAFIVLEEKIRENAIETIQWFKENGVEIKIISGDDPATVAKIAQRVGVNNADKYVSLENFSLTEIEQMASEFTVFGRVTPEQKYTLVKALKNKGNVVAMTGDGVNDTLALKEADCSIAMADGSEVARSISKLVLLDSNFTALPAIVKEGRQVVNNVQNSSCLYLMKTFFAILLSVMTLIFGISYPFQPVNMFILEAFVIGLPSFILTFEPNNNQIKGNFIPQVMKKSIPRALLMFVNVIIVIFLSSRFTTLTEVEFKTLAVLTLTFTGFLNLVSLCWPMNLLKGATLGVSLFCIIFAIVFKGDFFMITTFTGPVLLTFFALLTCSILILILLFINRKNLAKLKQKIINLLQKE